MLPGLTLPVPFDSVAPGLNTAITITGGLGSIAIAYTTPNAVNLRNVVAYVVLTGVPPTAAHIVAALTQNVPPLTATPVSLTYGDGTRTDMVVGGNMANSGDWPTQVGGASVTGGQAVHTPGTTGSIRQPASLTNGATYRYWFDIVSMTAGNMQAFLTGGTGLGSATHTGVGLKVGNITNNSSGNNTVALLFSSTSDGVADNFGMYQVTGTTLASGTFDIYLQARNHSGHGTLQGPYTVTVI